MRLCRVFPCLFAAAIALHNGANADELPRWEIGVGVAGLSIPEYRGSDRQRGYLLPLPYATYRGKRVELDREGARSNLFRSERWTLELSLAAGPPSRSGDDGPRAGMPGIDPTLEIGPSLKRRLAESADGNRRVRLTLPLRAVVATDLSHTKGAGWVFAPYLEIETRRAVSAWTFSLSAGPIFASEAYHDYYYEVAPAFATPTRPLYDARAGYSGSRLTFTATRRFRRVWTGFFARYDTLAHAVFDDSPLVRRHHSLAVGGGIAWIIASSGDTVRER